MNDLRFAARQLFKSPGFTTIALLTLALGIGLNTSMFSLMNTLLFQPLPFPEKQHLIRLYRTTPQTQTAGHSVPDFIALERESREFAELTAFRMWSYSLAHGDRPPVNLNALRVSANFFSVLGVKPAAGRFFLAEEDAPGNNVIVLSHATWQAQFGGDPAAVGTTVRVDGQPTTIIGVAPAIAGSLFLWGPGDAFRPLAATDTEKADRTNASLQVFGRIRHQTLARVNAQFAVLGEELARHRPREQSQDGLRAVSLQSSTQNAGSTRISWMLLGLAGFVLLIACGNLANLQLARAVARAHEFAIRSALGASRARLLRPLLCESLILALGGGALGLLVATWTNDWMTSRLSANGLTLFTISLEWNVLLFALVIAAATGIAFGLVPAWLTSRVRPSETLKSGARGNTGDRAQHRLRNALIVVQFALALVLLTGAGVFIRGLDGLLAREIGWDRHSVLQAVLSPPQTRYTTPEQTYAFYTQLQERLSGLPGVQSVAIGWTVPIFQFLTSRNVTVDGRETPPVGREPLAFVNGVTPSYLPTLGIKLIAGRNFTAGDTAKSPHVVIINESMARTLFPNENPLGQRLRNPDPANPSSAEIVGVMPDLRFAVNPTTPSTRFQIFRPLAQETWNYVSIAIRADHPERLIDPMQRVVAQLDPDLPLQQVGTIDQQVERASSGFHLTNTILTAFALLGLFLSALGLYGVIARLVVQRTPEIGVRVALGAQARDVIWLVLRSGLRLTLLGTAIGLLGAIGFVKLIGSWMPELPVQDPVAISVVTVLLLSTAVVACWLPARRATKIDPMRALRAE